MRSLTAAVSMAVLVCGLIGEDAGVFRFWRESRDGMPHEDGCAFVRRLPARMVSRLANSKAPATTDTSHAGGSSNVRRTCHLSHVTCHLL